MSDRGRFVCLAHPHSSEAEEIACSAAYQIDNLGSKVERLEADIHEAMKWNWLSDDIMACDNAVELIRRYRPEFLENNDD